MGDEKFKAKVVLNWITYGGENIGNDWSFRFDVGGEIIDWDVQIDHGVNFPAQKVLYEKFIENYVALPIKIDITENDPVYPDKGLGMITLDLLHTWAGWWAIPGTPISDWKTCHAVVVGDPTGDPGRTALLTFSFYTSVGHCEANDEQIKPNVEKPNSEEFVSKMQVPALTPPDNVGLLLKDMLDSVGDPGGISGKVDKMLKLTASMPQERTTNTKSTPLRSAMRSTNAKRVISN